MLKMIFAILILPILSLSGEKVLYSIDFSHEKNGPAETILKAKGYKLMLDSKDIDMRFQDGRLLISTDSQKAALFGVILPKPLKNPKRMVIDWGVEKFPRGANWSRGNNRLAIGTIVVLGTEKFSSGVPLVQDVPYFQCIFIGKNEKAGKTYLGKMFKKSGRYYCVSNKKGEIKTSFDIASSFKRAFNKPVPPITAYGFQINTKNTKGGAIAFIKKVTFYGAK